MRVLSTVVITVVVLLLLVAASGALYFYSGAFDVAATAEHGSVTDRLLRTVRSNAVEHGAREIETPTSGPLEGEALTAAVLEYDSMCATCHAPPGRDETETARGLNPKPPDLADVATHHRAEELFWVAKNGIRMTGMPAWGVTHSDEELWRLVALVQMFPTMSGDEYERLLADARAAGDEHTHGDH